MKLKDIILYLESVCPPAYQESYDNCGLITGSPEQNITGALLCLDSTEDVIKEAIRLKYNLIIAHHPILFEPLKKLTGKTYPERVIIAAIKHGISIYAMHTNLDNIDKGVNHKISEKLGLTKLKILAPKEGLLKKLVTYCPVNKAEKVRDALFGAGAGVIGDYDECSFNTAGAGTFKAGKGTNPYVGAKGKRHYEKEERIETIYPAYLEKTILKELLKAHPYEEVAYDLYALENPHPRVGAGMIGTLEKPIKEVEFLTLLKKTFKAACIRHTALLGEKIEKVAVCGGSGSFLLPLAVKEGADILVTADFKYHQFFDADSKIVIADIGHYESEQYTPHIIYSLLKEKFNTFALQISKTNTNPVNYF